MTRTGRGRLISASSCRSSRTCSKRPRRPSMAGWAIPQRAWRAPRAVCSTRLTTWSSRRRRSSTRSSSATRWSRCRSRPCPSRALSSLRTTRSARGSRCLSSGSGLTGTSWAASSSRVCRWPTRTPASRRSRPRVWRCGISTSFSIRLSSSSASERSSPSPLSSTSRAGGTSLTSSSCRPRSSTWSSPPHSRDRTWTSRCSRSSASSASCVPSAPCASSRARGG
mmetsp:Transcript_21514/g.54241  ORF Transcript_21514/g.54241 Transcript_21514/m.54241 type:complete len:224 (-) Transcript_21514:2289-2960(-)